MGNNRGIFWSEAVKYLNDLFLKVHTTYEPMITTFVVYGDGNCGTLWWMIYESQSTVSTKKWVINMFVIISTSTSKILPTWINTWHLKIRTTYNPYFVYVHGKVMNAYTKPRWHIPMTTHCRTWSSLAPCNVSNTIQDLYYIDYIYSETHTHPYKTYIKS